MSTFAVEVVKVQEVNKHPNADRLDLVSIKGWVCVAGREDPTTPRYKKGDTCIYIPIDSVLPKQLEDYLFPPGSLVTLSKSRVKSVKIRKALSQGMVIDANKDLLKMYPKLAKIKLGDDVAAILGITKYEPPATGSLMGGNQARNHPDFHKYTDIENFKNFPDMFVEGEPCYITEKLHGTSARFSLMSVKRSFLDKILMFLKLKKEHEFLVGSRNVQLKKGTDVYNKIAKQLDLEKKLLPGEILYGEIVGSGIQANYTYGCKEGQHNFYAYDVKVNNEFLSPASFRMFCKERGINPVPMLHRGPFSLELANKLRQGDSLIGGQKVREGIVIKPIAEDKSWTGARKVLKFINDTYLLKDNTDFH